MCAQLQSASTQRMQRFIKHRGLPILQKKCAQIALVNKSNKKYLVIILQQQDTLAVYLLLSRFLFPLLSFSCSFHISSPRVVVAAVFQRNIAYQIELHLNISPFATATLTHTQILTHTHSQATLESNSVEFSQTLRLVMHVCSISKSFSLPIFIYSQLKLIAHQRVS